MMEPSEWAMITGASQQGRANDTVDRFAYLGACQIAVNLARESQQEKTKIGQLAFKKGV
jgi:hypothetical protein